MLPVVLNGSSKLSWGIMNWTGAEMEEMRNISSIAVFFIMKSSRQLCSVLTMVQHKEDYLISAPCAMSNAPKKNQNILQDRSV